MINPKIKEMILQIISEQDNDISVSERVDRISEQLSIYHQELEFQNDELRRIQQHMERNQKIFQSIFDEAPIGYIVTDEEGTIHKVNETILASLKRDVSDFLRQPLSSLIAPNSQDQYYFLMKNLRERRSLTNERIHFRTAAGSLPLLVQAKCYTDEDRGFIRFALIDLQALQDSIGSHHL